MLSPLVQRLIGAAATAVCGLCATAIVGLVVMYGDIRELKAEVRAERLMVERSLAAIRADVMLMHGRMTEHQRDHER